MNNKKIIYEAMEKSKTDKAFRKLLLSNPKETIKKASGIELPEDMKIKFIEKDADVSAMFILPDYNNKKLSDEELEEICGGAFINSIHQKC